MLTDAAASKPAPVPRREQVHKGQGRSHLRSVPARWSEKHTSSWSVWRPLVTIWLFEGRGSDLRSPAANWASEF